MKKKKIKEPKQNGLSHEANSRICKKAKGSKKLYWTGRRDFLKVQ